MKIITSRDNSVFKELRGLAHDARETRKRGMTIIDGPHLVDVYRQRMGLPNALFVSESGLVREEVSNLLQQHQGLEAVVLKDALFKEVSPTQSPVGIIAVIDIPAAMPAAMSEDAVFLEGLQDPGNLGTILRSAAAFGVRQVFLSPSSVGAWTPKVLRAAQGAHFSLQIHERIDLVSLLQQFSVTRVATVVTNAESIYGLKLHRPVAWVIGNEGQGVSPELVAACDYRATIPISVECESLNAGVAASICLAEMNRQRTAR